MGRFWRGDTFPIPFLACTQASQGLAPPCGSRCTSICVVKNKSSVWEEIIGNTPALQAELLRLQLEEPQMSFGNVVQNLDGETKDHFEEVRKLLTSERQQHSEERERNTKRSRTKPRL